MNEALVVFHSHSVFDTVELLHTVLPLFQTKVVYFILIKHADRQALTQRWRLAAPMQRLSTFVVAH